METLLLNGKRYMKASSASRETGYTMDYIGQLCRKKKIDAQLVGRTWYVLESEITEHRRTRGRSSSVKVREAVHKAVSQTVQAKSHVHPEYRKRLVAHEVRYHTDDSELLPKLASRHLGIKSSDKETVIHPSGEAGVSVTSEEKEASLHPVRTTHSDIKWNGTIIVSPLDEEASEEAVADSNTKETAHIEPIIEAGGRSVAVRVVTEDAAAIAADTEPDAVGEPDDEPEMPARRESEPRPAFIDRLNHAHVLNELGEDDAPEPESESFDQLVVGRKRVPKHSTAGFAATLAVGIASIALVFSNLLIERVVYIDRDMRGQDEYRMMSLRYDFISAESMGTKAASVVTSLRNIYNFQDSSPNEPF